MDQNLVVVAKKFWKIVRVAMCMLRKGISKQKIMLDVKLMMKRSKISSYKATVHNLMFHFHHNIHNRRSQDVVKSSNLPFCPPHDEDEYYEFSCSSSPNLDIKKKYTTSTEEDVVVMNAAVMKALEMIKAETMSPDNYVRGFGRQLRVTDSPFSVKNEVEESDNNNVDEAADEFISKFYRNLRRQSSLSAS